MDQDLASRSEHDKIEQAKVLSEVYQLLAIAFHREGLLCPERSDPPTIPFSSTEKDFLPIDPSACITDKAAKDPSETSTPRSRR